MKIWHDDIRKPPDDTWTWARTNTEAMACFAWADSKKTTVEEISLDHDLGLSHIDPDVYERRAEELWVFDERHEEDGLALVDWMCRTGHVPPRVTIHSWNPDGAQNMAARLNRFGHDCIVRAYEAPA